MLAKEITYSDAAGEQVTETFYFNLTKAEITEMEYSVKGGLTAMINSISTTKDVKTIITIAKKLILLSFGEKYVDDKGVTRFLKNDNIRDAFSATEAYSELFMSFVQDANKFNDFIIGIMPLDMQAEIRKNQSEKAANNTLTVNETSK